MSNSGPPPSSHNPHASNLYGFGQMHGLPNYSLADITQSQMATDASNDIMSLIDGSMFNGFDPMPMNLDSLDDSPMPQSFSSIPTAQGQLVTSTESLLSDDGVNSNVPGAGPPPLESYGAQAGGIVATTGGNGNNGNNSMLTEFTKRRNWSAKVMEELKDFLHILDANGRIKHVSPSITAVTGYAPEEVMDRFLRDLIHPDDVGVFVSELNESIASASPLRLFYRMRKKDGTYGIFETTGHAHIAAAKFAPNPNNQSPFCQAVFMMARPYPTKNANLLDSFLEHKMENERLRRRIAELRREEEAADAEDSRTYSQSRDAQSEVTGSEDLSRRVGPPPLFPTSPTHDSTMPPPERPSAALNAALTRENLEGVAGSRQDSIREKMARYEGATHADTIEMLTGLRYTEGERSRGITTGNASPTLIKGDAGIAIPVDRDPRTGEKKKKIKLAEEYVCTDCGTLDSPEWRKGPSGPKTLCNACGLRWAKKEKKLKTSGGSGGAGAGGPAESAA